MEVGDEYVACGMFQRLRVSAGSGASAAMRSLIPSSSRHHERLIAASVLRIAVP